jgi:hypothetical protein
MLGGDLLVVFDAFSSAERGFSVKLGGGSRGGLVQTDSGADEARAGADTVWAEALGLPGPAADEARVGPTGRGAG